MNKYYITLLTQLKNSYHLEESEIKDLEQYLKEQLRQIEFIKKLIEN